MSFIKSFSIDKPQSNVVYYNCFDEHEYKLNLKNITLFVYNKRGVKIIGGDPQDISSDPVCRDATSNAYAMIETKRTTILQGTLVYMECKPLFYGDNKKDLYAVVLIIIPYKEYERKVMLKERKPNTRSLFSRLCFSAQAHDDTEEPSIHESHCYDSLDQIRSESTVICFSSDLTKYALNIDSLQSWIFDRDSHCIFSSSGDKNIIGVHASDMKFCDDKGIWETLIKDALGLKETKQTAVSRHALVYIEAKPLFYKNSTSDVYGVLFIVIPYSLT